MKIGTKSTIAMKKIFYIITAAALSLVACSRNQEVDVPDANLSLFARTEPPADTKTVVESGVHVFWEPGDEIAVFMGEQSAKFTTDITAASGTATFKGTFGDATWPEDLDLWAVYPFSEDAIFDGETITTTLPSEQVAREGSFGKDMNLAIAHSNSSTLQFYNVGGGIRFSVLEEGIKKVMFEGLGGEIISGKVKIGLDENGKPVVREVTGGSQFITLLPPDGSESFQKDTWYYIVVIPGALEKGYKLRFYKDSDYARKVSEKAVTIKRSIYGNIEKADEGIKYKATTTKFPETEYEWEESFAITDRVTVDVERLISLYKRGEIDVSKIAEELIKDEDIVDVAVNPEKTTVAFMQKDSIWLNVFLTTQPEIPEDFSFNSPSANKSEIDSHKSPQIQDNKKQSTVLEEGKTALILTPFQKEWEYPIDEAETQLKSAGFTSVVKKSDKDAGIEAFWGENLDGYDFIMINTHGGTCYRHKEPKGELKSFQTVFCSSTVYRSDFIRFFQDLFGDVDYDPETVAISYESEAKKWFVCMTTDFLDKASFDNTLVLTTACESMKITDDSDGKTSMAKAFINHGATIFAGYKETISRNVSQTMAFGIVKFMCYGFGFSTASEFWQNHEGLREACEANIRYGKDHGWSEEDLAKFDPDLYDYYPPACSQYLFFDAAPLLNEEEINEGQVILSWDCRLKPFDDMFIYDLSEYGYGNNSFYHTFDIAYDVYVGGSRLGKNVDPDDRDKTASCTLSPGEYTWYVVAKIMEGNTVLASYQSAEGHFTISDGNLDDIPGHNI